MASALDRRETLDAGSRRTRTAWSTALAAVLLVALGFGAGFRMSQLTQDDQVGLADESTTSLIEKNMAAFNAGRGAALARTYAKDAVFTRIGTGGEVAEFRGPAEISQEIDKTYQLRAESQLMASGNLITMTYSEASTSGVTVLEISGRKITHEWVIMDQ